MPILLNTLLIQAGLSPKDVRILRHKDRRATKGRRIYELWRDNPGDYDLYQSRQRIKNRKRLDAPYWASFVANQDGETIFTGIFSVKNRKPMERDMPAPHIAGGIDKAKGLDVYELTLHDALKDHIGRLIINWGSGYRTWIQRAERQNKSILSESALPLSDT